MKKVTRMGLLMLVLAMSVLSPSGGRCAYGASGDLAAQPAFSDIAGHPAEAAFTVLGALGIFSGSAGLGGPVDPDASLTREQFCKVIVVALGAAGEADAKKNSKPGQFKDADDISPWAWGYVNAAVDAGIINGYQDGTFWGSNPLTYAEAVKMLIAAVPGHVGQVDPAAAWPYGYLFYGTEHGFTDGVDVAYASAPCTRGDMARMLFATMQVAPLESDGTPVPDKALLPATDEGRRIWTSKFDSQADGQVRLAGGAGPIGLGDTVYLVGAVGYEDLAGKNVLCVADASGRVVVIISTGEVDTP